MNEDNFYSYRDGTKLELCKKCLTAHVNNWDESTFLWIIEKVDIPYIPKEWNILRDRYEISKPGKMTGMTIIGRYISKMKLNQWSKYTWADSEMLQEKDRKEMEIAAAKKPKVDPNRLQELQQQYENGEISEAELKTYSEPRPDNPLFAAPPISPYGEVSEPVWPTQQLPDLDLTEEDIRLLSIKWGANYNPHEWVKLEEFYEEMTKSFDIRDADSKATLKFICKTNLKMNQMIDCGDMETFAKLARTYNTLRQSAKFTAAQNKDQGSDAIDSVGELVAMCEQHGGFIPRFCIDAPKDKVDATLRDFKKYTKDLVINEMGLEKQIDIAVQKMMQAQESEEIDFDYDTEDELDDLDMMDYNDFREAEAEEDKKNIENLTKQKKKGV